MTRARAVGADRRLGPGIFIASLLSSLLASLSPWAQAPDDCLGLILLDLDGDGLRLSDLHYPVRFDIDGDSVTETVSWTATNHDEAFLWLVSRSRSLPANGSDLLTSTPALRPEEGWESALLQLSRLDDRGHGGNGDGLLSPKDRSWSDLRLWTDRDHDGRARQDEISDLDSRGILRIELHYQELHRVDGNANRHLRASRFVLKRDGAREVSSVTEVCFQVADSDAPPRNRSRGILSPPQVGGPMQPMGVGTETPVGEPP